MRYGSEHVWPLHRVNMRRAGNGPGKSRLDTFLRSLRSPGPANTFNPWRELDPATDLSRSAPGDRLARLEAHLSTPARYVLVGEAAGYQGCKVSGIAFTSERLILEGRIPRVEPGAARLTSRQRPWSEPSATTVWGTLHEIGIAADTILWNAFPWHPHLPDRLHSNRPPAPGERPRGLATLALLLALYPRARVFAVGRQAQAALDQLHVPATPLRHPSMGGAARFRRELREALS